MAKYDALTQRLSADSADSLTISFADLDELVDDLPPSAREHRTWWGNAKDSTGQARAWLDAGWLVSSVDLEDGAVTFSRQSSLADDESIRRPVLVRALFDVLTASSGPLAPGAALDAVASSVELTAVELSLNDSGYRRFDTFLRFVSSWATKVGWMSKRGGWSITEAGIDAAQRLDDGELYRTLTKEYRARIKETRVPGQVKTQRLERVLEALGVVESGRWTSFTDLREALGFTDNQIYADVEGLPRAEAKRVLRSDGTPSLMKNLTPDWQHAALEDEGVSFDDAGRANPEQRVTAEDLIDAMSDIPGSRAGPRAWFVRAATATDQQVVAKWLAEGWVSIGALSLRQVDEGASLDELRVIVDEDYAHASYAQREEQLEALHSFLSRMRLGDLVSIANDGRLHVGQIGGAVVQVDESRGGLLRRPVDWGQRLVEVTKLPKDLVARIQVQGEVVDLTKHVKVLESILSGAADFESDILREPLVLPPATDELASALHVGRDWLQECIDLLHDRPQLIFYGPPGTGKTFIAQHLAEHIAGDNVRIVQFHPAYSYEDFFEGYRPMPSGGFALKPGPMRKIVDQATADSSVPHVLIIDEINRGNLAKVFGELYFLLEYRDKNVDLLYGEDGKGFTLPPNVFMIGTMNTADRSIALVDAAMRRRFAFLPLHPSELPTRDVLHRWLKATGRSSQVAELLAALNDRIDDPDFKIGPSYFMRPAVHESGGLERVWRTSILPLLEEHHFGEMDGRQVADRYGLLAIEEHLKGVEPLVPDNLANEVDDNAPLTPG